MKSALSQLVIAAVVLLCAVAGYFFWYSSVAADQQEVTSLSASISAAQLNAARLAAAQTALNDVASTETLVESYFISDTTIANFLSQLQDFGKSAGSAVTIQSVSADAHSNTLSITVTITGGFDSVMRTEGLIEHAPYDLANRGFSISESTDSKNALWSADSIFIVGTSLASSSSFSAPAQAPPAPASDTGS